MEIALNDAEQRLVKYLAQKRFDHDRAVNAKATIYHDASALENEINSMGAELAYCKMVNCYPDLDPGHFGAFDALRRDGATVDIKNTVRPLGRLLVKAKGRNSDPDLYVLMIGKFPIYQYAGEIRSSDVLQECNIDKSLPFPAYAVDKERLWKS